MPDPLALLSFGCVSAMLAGTAVLLCSWPWRKPRPVRAAAGSLLGLLFGTYVGYWLFDRLPRWPPREASDRLLLVLLPALFGVELLAAYVRHEVFAWTLRLLIAGIAAPIFLHNTVYVADLSGPNTREWHPFQTAFIFGGLFAALACTWTLLASLTRRTGGRSVSFTVALACAGSTLSIMLSGYASIAEIGVPWTAALTGIAFASLLLSGNIELQGTVGASVVGLFALLMAGRFFGTLSTEIAALLFFAPLLGWLPELPVIRQTRPIWRGIGRLMITAAPVMLALFWVWQRFEHDVAPVSPKSGTEPSVEDYLNYVK